MKRILIAIALMVISSKMYAENATYTPQEIWREGASWTSLNVPQDEVGTDKIERYSINGTIEYKGKSYMRIICGDKYENYAVRMEEDKLIALTCENFPDSIQNAQEVVYYDFAHPFDEGKIVQEYLLVDDEGKETIETDSLQKPLCFIKWIPSAEASDKGLNYYQSSYTLNWYFDMKAAAFGIGYVNGDDLLKPIRYSWPISPTPIVKCVLEFFDAEGNVIFRNPHYDMIIGASDNIELPNADYAELENITIHSLSGTETIKITSASELESLRPGFYIKRQGNRIEKILVK